MSSSERTDRATALITGASSGIGYQYARQLAARGYDLLIVSNDAEGIANSAAEIRKQYGVRITPLYRDLSAENAAEDLYRYCEDEQLDVEVLVNNAGVFFFDDLARVDSRRIELMLRLHVRTTTLLCHYFGRPCRHEAEATFLICRPCRHGCRFPAFRSTQRRKAT